jgi:hypothetical protein
LSRRNVGTRERIPENAFVLRSCSECPSVIFCAFKCKRDARLFWSHVFVINDARKERGQAINGHRFGKVVVDLWDLFEEPNGVAIPGRAGSYMVNQKTRTDITT